MRFIVASLLFFVSSGSATDNSPTAHIPPQNIRNIDFSFETLVSPIEPQKKKPKRAPLRDVRHETDLPWGGIRDSSRALMCQQEALDEVNDQFTPVLGSKKEKIPELPDMSLNEPVATGITSRVFASTALGLILKYQVDYPNSETRCVDHLIPDFHFTREASAIGVAPEVIFLSPGKFLPPRTTSKTAFYMENRERSYLVRSGAMVRFMVTRSAGKSLLKFAREQKGLSFQDAVDFGRRTVRLLQRLHSEAAVIHGDIHLGNVCFSNSDRSTLKLIDFGNAFRVSDETDKKWGFPKLHCQHTPWEASGYRYARRDDIYKAFSMIAQSSVGVRRYVREAEQVMMNRNDFIEWKRGIEMFKANNFDPVGSSPGLSEDQKTQIWRHLTNISGILNSLTSVKTEIPYQQIIDELDAILGQFAMTSQAEYRPA